MKVCSNCVAFSEDVKGEWSVFLKNYKDIGTGSKKLENDFMEGKNVIPNTDYQTNKLGEADRTGCGEEGQLTHSNRKQ